MSVTLDSLGRLPAVAPAGPGPVQLPYLTQSLCPHCAQTVHARIVERDGEVFMEKTCPKHGAADVYLWPDADHYKWLADFRLPHASPRAPRVRDGACPSGCGLCASHVRSAALVEIEVTRLCDLRCPVCFVAAGTPLPDPDMNALKAMFAAALAQTGSENSVQLTGGEPTVRDDLPEIVRAGRAIGFRAIEINTNGLRIGTQSGYIETLRDAGISGVYLQFDGMTDQVHRALRGGSFQSAKLAAVERCREAGVQVVLAMTVVRDVNDDQVGSVLDFALENRDVVAGVAYQPAFTSGRFQPDEAKPIGLGDVVVMLEEQSRGLLASHDLWPLSTSHPLCSVGTLLLPRGGTHEAVTRSLRVDEYLDQYDPSSPQGSVFADLMAKRGIPVEDGLSVVVMNYMDIGNIDLARLRECSMVVTMEDGRLVPFCAYQLTTAVGDRLHPTWGRSSRPDGAIVRDSEGLATQERG